MINGELTPLERRVPLLIVTNAVWHITSRMNANLIEPKDARAAVELLSALWLPRCCICDEPLSPSHTRLKVTAHFPCIFREAYGGSMDAVSADDRMGGFDGWKRQVAAVMEARYGVHPDDLPDYDYFEAYDTGVDPVTAAKYAIRNARGY